MAYHNMFNLALNVAIFLGGNLLKKIFWFFIAWAAAPSILFVLAASLLLYDCDFGLWLASYRPNNAEEEEQYFRERVCWITGATSGIGRSLSHLLAERGAYLILSGRDEFKLRVVADECLRACLVQGIRTCRRSATGVAEAIAEASDAENPRTFVVPFDLGCDAATIRDAVEKAVAWKGRVDALFNNGGISERAILPSAAAEDNLFRINCISHINLTKALIPYAFQPLEAPKIPKASISWKKIPSTDFRETARTVGEFVRSASIVGFQRSSDFVFGTSIGRTIRCWFTGDSIDYNRTFHIVNTASIYVRTPAPGSAAYSAAKTALTAYCDVLQVECRGMADEGKHRTKVAVTNVLPGEIETSLLMNCVLSNGQPAKDSTNSMNTGKEISSKRCAELIIRATVNELNECWICRQPRLTHVYAQYYLPWIWRYYSFRFLQLSDYNKIVEYNEKCDNVSSKTNDQRPDKKND